MKNKKYLQHVHLLTDSRVLGLIGFGIIALLVTWSGVKVVQKNYELDKKISIAKQRNDIQKLENENLKLRNTYYGTNQFLELAARRQFGKAAPGETLYLIPESVALAHSVDVPKPASAAPQPDTQQPTSKYQKNLDDWLQFLFE